MTVSVDIFDSEFDGDYKTWEFKVNSLGYIDLILSGKVVDTLYDLGKYTSQSDLEKTVKHLLTCWKVTYKNFK